MEKKQFDLEQMVADLKGSIFEEQLVSEVDKSC